MRECAEVVAHPRAPQSCPQSSASHAVSQMRSISKPGLCSVGDGACLKYNRKMFHWYQEVLRCFLSKLATLNVWRCILLNFICRCLLVRSSPGLLYNAYLFNIPLKHLIESRGCVGYHLKEVLLTQWSHIQLSRAGLHGLTHGTALGKPFWIQVHCKHICIFWEDNTTDFCHC